MKKSVLILALLGVSFLNAQNFFASNNNVENNIELTKATEPEAYVQQLKAINNGCSQNFVHKKKEILAIAGKMDRLIQRADGKVKEVEPLKAKKS